MRYRPSPMSMVPILSGLALILAACATSPGKLDVDLQALKECQRLQRQMAVGQIGEDSDYRELSAEALAEIAKGNRTQAARTACENKVIEKYRNAT